MTEVIVQQAVEREVNSSVSAEMPVAPMEQFEVECVTPNDPEDDFQYPTTIKLVAIAAALAIVLISLGLDVSIVAVTVPALSNEFHSIADIGWYSSSLRLVMCSFMFLFGKAYTLFSIKRVFMLSIATFELGNVVCTFAQSSSMFIAGRAICGFGCAGLLGGIFTIFALSFPRRQRPLVIGIGGGIETLASVSAPLIGGALIDAWTWRACFGINIPLGIAGCAVVGFYLELPYNSDIDLPWKEKIKRIDILGTAFFVPAMVSLLLALQWGGSVFGFGSARIIALFVLSAVLFTLFFITEYLSGEKASLPFRILKNRSILAGAFFALCANATISVTQYYLSIYFQGVRGYSAAKTGLFSLPMVVGMAVACTSAGAITTWIGYYFPAMYLTAVLASISSGLITTIDIDTDLPKLLCLLGLLGFAVGAGIQAPQVAAQTVLPAKDVSIGTSIVLFGNNIGCVIFLATSAGLFTNRLNVEIKAHAPSTNMTSIQNMGLSDIRNNFGGEKLKDILLGYDQAVVQTLYLPVALACLTLMGAVAIERKSVKMKTS